MMKVFCKNFNFKISFQHTSRFLMPLSYRFAWDSYSDDLQCQESCEKLRILTLHFLLKEVGWERCCCFLLLSLFYFCLFVCLFKKKKQDQAIYFNLIKERHWTHFHQTSIYEICLSFSRYVEYNHFSLFSLF